MRCFLAFHLIKKPPQEASTVNAMDTENNPYLTPNRGPSASTLGRKANSGEVTESANASWDPIGMRIMRVFVYSYITSLVVGVSVAVVGVIIMVMATPQAQNPSSPDILQLIFVLITTLPSVFTCFIFSWCYSSLCWKQARPGTWPALVFGILSGMLFNAFTAISVIEYFFKW